jgi:hypothetical protein
MSAKGDLHTILRHLASNTQWGGNQGEKAETMEALDRLTDDTDEARTADDVNDASRKDPDVGGGSVPGNLKATTPAKATGTKR